MSFFPSGFAKAIDWAKYRLHLQNLAAANSMEDLRSAFEQGPLELPAFGDPGSPSDQYLQARTFAKMRTIIDQHRAAKQLQFFQRTQAACNFMYYGIVAYRYGLVYSTEEAFNDAFYHYGYSPAHRALQRLANYFGR